MADSQDARPGSNEKVVEEYSETIQPNPRGSHVPEALSKDIVAAEAVGGAYAEMPKGYYWSKGFLGTLVVSI